jgi:Putative beta-barrel porin-2, OmpL-like. bbp2
MQPYDRFSHKCILFLIGALLVYLVDTKNLHAQTESKPEPLTVGAFADAYYAYDFNNLPTRYRPYATQPYFDKEPALNLGFVDARLSTDELRGRLAFQYGSSVVSNYAAAPELFWRYIQEAVVGYKVADGLWIEGGIYLSHIGLESWISRDNWTYTRSLIAEYSPYYQEGVKLSYEISPEWSAQVHVLNGWQNISDDRNPALGTQISFVPSAETSLTYNTFIGYESGHRFFNDFVFKQKLTESLSLAASIDVGFQKRIEQDDTAVWHGWALIGQYKVSEPLRIAGRVERYSDPEQVILTSLGASQFSVTALSVNVDVDVTKSLLWRTEYRVFLDDDNVFPKGSGFSGHESFVVTSLTYTFGT